MPRRLAPGSSTTNQTTRMLWVYVRTILCSCFLGTSGSNGRETRSGFQLDKEKAVDTITCPVPLPVRVPAWVPWKQYLKMEGVVSCHSLLGLGAEGHLPHVLREVVHHALAVPLRRVEVKDQVNLHRNKKYTHHTSVFSTTTEGTPCALRKILACADAT